MPSTSIVRMDLLAANRATICACPTTERNLGDVFFLRAMLMERGISVALAPTVRPDLTPEDARELEYHLRLQESANGVFSTASTDRNCRRVYCGCATANGANALGCDTGEMQAGKLADFFTVIFERRFDRRQFQRRSASRDCVRRANRSCSRRGASGGS